MQIDAHHHLWSLARGDYGWLTPDLAAIHRDFGPGDLEPLLAAADVDRTILVQAAPTTAETDFLLQLAETTPFVAGVVGWVDVEAADAPDRIAALAANPLLKGLRPMIQDMADDAWMLQAGIAPAIEAMIAHGLTFDALVKPRHLPILQQFAGLYPGLDIVIDHGGKPDIAGGDIAGWTRDIRAVAAGTRMFCKLSGLITEAAPDCTAADLRPVVEVLIEAFGADRLMWGSDWPVLNLNGGYRQWRSIAVRMLAGVSGTEQEAVFGRTAANFYGLKR